MKFTGDTDYDTGVSYFGANLTIAVLNGTVPQWRVDDMAVRIMAAFNYVGRNITRDPINFSSWTTDTYGYDHYYAEEGWTQVTMFVLHDVVLCLHFQINHHVDVRGNHAKLIREIGAQSTILLKNVNGTLPLDSVKGLTAVFGEDAGANPDGPNVSLPSVIKSSFR